ncbi:MAG: AAA family ATPase [Lachnospiraceae bacterium]|nr:AAA family ATPase [Lachnospiraceae bacterium]
MDMKNGFGALACPFEEIMEQAESGSPDAMYLAGEAYTRGSDVIRDYEKAFEWYQKAADLGQPDAICALGHMYELGKGGYCNRRKALELYERAADMGNALAMYYLGNVYHEGTCAEKEEAKAAEWYQKAADGGNVFALDALGNQYAEGRGVSRDHEKAIELFEKSARGGYPKGMKDLADAYHYGLNGKRDITEAFQWYQKAADRGELSALLCVANALLEGEGTEKDRYKAIACYKKAAGRGEPTAMYLLGAIYSEGIVVPKDMEYALTWYRKAAEKHKVSAMKYLGDAYYTGNGVEKNLFQAYDWYWKAHMECNEDDDDDEVYLKYCQKVSKEINEAEERERKAARGNNQEPEDADEEDFYGEDFYEEENESEWTSDDEADQDLFTALDEELSESERAPGASDDGEEDESDAAPNDREQEDSESIQNEEDKEPEAEPEALSEEAFTYFYESYMALFERCHLSQNSMDEIETYIRYLLAERSSRPQLPFRFMVHTENEAEAKQLEDVLFTVLQKDKVADYAFDYAFDVDEEDYKDREVKWDKEAFRRRLSDTELLQVVEANGTDFLNDTYDMLSIRITPDRTDLAIDKEKTENARWKRIWGELERCFKENPNMMVFLYGDSRTLRERFAGMDEIYHRVMRNHLYFSEWSEEEIQTCLMESLDEKGFHAQEDFLDDIREYIHVVYRKADLNGYEFVADLVERILNRYYRKKGESAVLDVSCVPYYKKPVSIEEAFARLDQMVGMSRVKEAFRDIALLYGNQNVRRGFQGLHMVFSGNAGTGKTVTARLAADLLYSLGIMKTNKVVKVSSEQLIGKYVGHTAPQTREWCRRAYDGMLFIDEAYLLDPKAGGSKASEFREECIGTLIQEMEDNREKLIVIFAGYPDKMENLMKSNEGLRSRIYKVIPFDDFTEEELVLIFRQLCDKNGYTLDPAAEEKLHKKFRAQMVEPDFGNARGARNVFGEIEKNYRESGREDGRILPEDVRIGEEEKSFEELLGELRGMVGLKEAKDQIERFIATARMNRLIGRESIGGNHLLFLGNAGTGKTTVARLYSRMLYSLELTRSPKTVCITSHELFSSYQGESAKKLRDFCSKAMGGVLFIDEAYLLAENPSIFADCSAVLLDVLENRREDLVIILAGYEAEMKRFLSQNQGLASRFIHTVHFADFSVDELCELFIRAFREMDFTVEPEALDRLRECVERVKDSPQFGNARTIRNAADETYQRHAQNYMNAPESHALRVITAEDIALGTDYEIREGGRTVGFRV